MKKIKVGVAGLGMVAQIMHLPYLHEMDGFEISAVCDVSKKLGAWVGRQYGVGAVYNDYREMIEKAGLDAVFILTFYHSDIAKAAARAGLHIFCEKPVAFSERECGEMMKAADGAGVKFMVGYMKRYDDSYRLGQKYFAEMAGKGEVRQIDVFDACFQNDLVLRSMHQVKQFGDIPAGVIKKSGAAMEKRISEALGAGAPKKARAAYRVLLETGSHDANVLRGAFGTPKKVLSTEIWPGGNWFCSTMDYGGDVRCTFAVARTARNWGDEHITAYGMKSTVSVEFPVPFQKNGITVVRRTRMKGDSTTIETTSASNSEAFRNELLHFHDCITKDRQPLTSIGDGMEDTKFMTGIIRAYGK